MLAYRSKTLPLCLFALLSGSLIQAAAPKAGPVTALDRYVQAPDSNYKYELLKTIPGENLTTYVLELTSQSWRSASEVNKTVWKHWLTIVKPHKLSSDIAFLFITGGSTRTKLPEKPDIMLLEAARTTGSVAVEIKMVPNQPLVFPDDKRELVEDGIITYTWNKFLRGGDDQWPLRLPMTKAAVRAMDTVTAFLAKTDQPAKVERFVVAGGSKRGWTTWTTAAVDKRVIAISPMVIDVLNIEPSMRHHFRAYGRYAEAVQDYTERKIMDWAGTKRYHELMVIEEPFSYRDRLTMPKFMINAAGDQFFLPDSSQFYFPELKGEKYLRYVPNADHSLKNSDAFSSFVAFYDSVLKGTPRPKFSWKFEKDGSIRVKAETKPSAVKVWAATNPEKRDFRLMTIGPAYKSTDLAESGSGVYIAKMPKPEKGWTAFFVELTFPSGGKYPFKFTTAVRVIPDVYPFPAPRVSPPVTATN